MSTSSSSEDFVLPDELDIQAQSWSQEQKFVIHQVNQIVTHEDYMKMPPFQRIDSSNTWKSMLQVVLLGWILVPIRLALIIPASLVYMAVSFLFDQTPYSRLSLRKRRFFDVSYHVFGWCMCVLTGFWHVKSKHVSVEQLSMLRERYTDGYDSGDEHMLRITQETRGIRPFIIVSNHISNIDSVILSYVFGSMSFLVTSKLRRMWLVGRYARKMEYLFYGGHDSRAHDAMRDVESGHEHNSSPIVDAMRQRSEKYYRRWKIQLLTSDRREGQVHEPSANIIREYNGPLPPPRLMIYSEGTMTNGKSLLHFHLGAFQTGDPIELVVVRYPYWKFNPSSTGKHNHLGWLLVLMSQLYNRVELVRFPPYVPTLREVQDPELYASNVRRVMCQGCNMFHPNKDQDRLHLTLSPNLFKRRKRSSKQGEAVSGSVS